MEMTSVQAELERKREREREQLITWKAGRPRAIWYLLTSNLEPRPVMLWLPSVCFYVYSQEPPRKSIIKVEFSRSGTKQAKAKPGGVQGNRGFDLPIDGPHQAAAGMRMGRGVLLHFSMREQCNLPEGRERGCGGWRNWVAHQLAPFTVLLRH